MENSFFEHGKTCPVCNRKLSLYMMIDGIGTFKCSNNFFKNKRNKFNFFPLKDDVFRLHNSINKSDSLVIQNINDSEFNLTFHSESLFRAIEHSSLSFFYICNLESISSNGYGHYINDYIHDCYNVCYYKRSNDLTFHKNETGGVSLLTCKDGMTKVEIFSIQKDNKLYSLVYNFDESKTKLYYNFVSDDKSNTPNFVKELDLLSYYPDFSNHDKIIDKLDSWVLLS